MSDEHAIKAVTEGLRKVVAKAFDADADVVVKPLDKMDGGKLNVHLYQIVPNAAFRNADLPGRGNPLALNLRYLLIALDANDALQAQADLGLGMRALHDTSSFDPGGAAFLPIERARVTMHAMSLDDMDKLWAGYTGSRRLAVAYEVSVVLIESEQPAKMALPVLSRGTGNPDSIEVLPRMQPFPTIERIEIGSTAFDVWARARRVGRSVAQIDDDLFLYGQGLTVFKNAEIASLRFPNQKVTLDFQPEPGAVRVRLAAATIDGKLPPGICSIRLRPEKPLEDEGSNSVPFSLAAKIEALNPTTLTVPADLAVTFRPALVDRQRISLIVGNREVRLSNPGAGGSKTFKLKKEHVQAGENQPVRLRVDGVDSIQVDLTKAPPEIERPRFSSEFRITVQ